MKIDASTAGFMAAVADAIRELEGSAPFDADFYSRVSQVHFAYEGEEEGYMLNTDGNGGFFIEETP